MFHFNLISLFITAYLFIGSGAQSNVLLTYQGTSQPSLSYTLGKIQPSGQILWSPPIEAASGIGDTLSTVEFNGKIYVFHQGWGNNGQVWVRKYDISSFTWEEPEQNIFATVGAISYGPSAVVYSNQIWVFYILPSGLYYITSSDGVTWSSGIGAYGLSNIQSAPSAVVYNSVLYVFYLYTSNGDNLVFNTYNGASWSSLSIISPRDIQNAPSTIVANGNLYVFHSYGSGYIIFDVYNGNSWTANTGVAPLWQPINSNSGPAVALINGYFYIFYVGADNLMYYSGINSAGLTNINSLNVEQGPLYRVYQVPSATYQPSVIVF